MNRAFVISQADLSPNQYDHESEHFSFKLPDGETITISKGCVLKLREAIHAHEHAKALQTAQAHDAALDAAGDKVDETAAALREASGEVKAHEAQKAE